MANYLTVDNREEMDFTDDKHRNVLKRIFEHLKPNNLNEVIQEMIERFGDCETDDEHCGICVNYVDTYTWEL